VEVEANGTRLWFDVEGPALVPHGPEMRQRPTVVLLHGGPGSYDHSYFKPDFARLGREAQVVYLDLRGHGRSAWGHPDVGSGLHVTTTRTLSPYSPNLPGLWGKRSHST
jgi:proline iminopeptidase